MEERKRTVIEFTDDKNYIREFLALPGRLYPRGERTQRAQEELEILTGTHVLSHYFKIQGLLVLGQDGRAVSRAVLTLYDGDETAYLGYFESENDPDACRLLAGRAEELARAAGCTRIAGPVDASFWIRYRFKQNRFGSPYTGEPYNREYYTALWRGAGFAVADTYYSNHYPILGEQANLKLYSDRLRQKQREGYVIKSPSADTFDRALREVYRMLITLYSRFPAYKYITEEEFVSLYSYLKQIIDYDMVRLAYYEGQPAGFFISIPNYRNVLYGKLSLPALLKLVRIRRRPKEYIMLYMGVMPEHRGLARALAEDVKCGLQRKGTPSVGALIRGGNTSKGLFRELVDYEYEYVLMGKEL